MNRPLLALALAAALSGGCASERVVNPPEVVQQVDLGRYLGRWYEQGRKPIRVQQGCYGSTATYAKGEEPGHVTVLNVCHDGGWDEEVRQVKGRAWVVDAETNAKLKVQFFWPFSGDYWIVDLDKPGYQWAVVGSPDREHLWLLTREPIISKELYEELIARAQARGYDTRDVLRTPQREAIAAP